MLSILVVRREAPSPTLPVEGGWSRLDIALFQSAFLSWLAVSSAVVYRSNPAHAALYVPFVLVAYLFSTTYLTCTKCCHYGENCYMLAGRWAGVLYRRRTGGYTAGEIAGFTLSWLAVGLYPSILVATGSGWGPLALYGALTALPVLLWLFLCGCPRCRNEICPLNRKFSRSAVWL